MKQRLLSVISLLILLALILPMDAYAVPVDTERKGDVTFYYHQEDLRFSGVEVHLYRVAQVHPDGTYTLLAPYSGYPVNIHGITTQTEWDQVTQTLEAYLSADAVTPDYTAVTDEFGMATLEALPTGMYLVLGQTVQQGKTFYTFHSFLLLMPRPDYEDNFHDYDLDVYPKTTLTVATSEISVTKLWRDEGHEEHRPDSVTVDILKNGVLYQSVTLSEANDWNFHLVSNEDAQWTVVERNVPEGYTVTVTEQNHAYTVTNTYSEPPDDPPPVDPPPDTGDIRDPWLYVVLMCLSGAVLVILSQWKERGRA